MALGLSLHCAGCYKYSYQERNGGDLSKVAIDRNLTDSRVRWSMWWGLRGNDYTPYGCGDGEHESGDPACTAQVALCEHGAGQVTTGMTWYSALTMVGSLGIAMPQKVTVYCVTDRGTGPVQPLSEPTQPNTETGPPPCGAGASASDSGGPPTIGP